jgi:ribonuclease HI
MFHHDTITVYTDGSSRGNPGPGGWGTIAVFGNESMVEIGGKGTHTTNNKMELQAAIEGLKVSLEKGCIFSLTQNTYCKA